MGTVTAVLADSVRLALPAEAGAIAALQRRSWLQTLPKELASDVLDSVGLDQMTQSWEGAILRPPLAQFRVLVALGDAGQDERVSVENLSSRRVVQGTVIAGGDVLVSR